TARSRHACDLDAGERIARRVARIREAEVRGGEGVSGVFERAHRAVAARGRIVHRGHVHRDGIGSRVEVHTAAGDAPIVLDLEGEARVAGAVRVRGGRVYEPTRRDIY